MSQIHSAAVNVLNTVTGMYAKNLPVTPGKNRSGTNTIIVVAVPAMSGTAKSLDAIRTAVFA